MVQNVQIVQPLRSVQIVLQPKNKFQSFQWFHRLRGSKRNDSQSFAKEIAPTGEGVNHIVKMEAFKTFKLFNRCAPFKTLKIAKTGSSDSNHREVD
jgi:hypothetical protein